MCRHKVINTNSFGCVVQCNSSNHLHLGFGNMLTLFSVKEFKKFQVLIQKIYSKRYSDLMLSGEKLFLNTDSNKVIIALNADELNDLNTLLSEAVLVLEVISILNPENIND